METLHSKKNIGGASTQKYVDIEEIKDGVIMLKNGALRAVLLVSAVNFDLKSSEEQDGIIGQYQNFLNSLDFPLQIIVSSRKLNIEPYLKFISEHERRQTNELLRLQISEYKNFVRNLTEVSNIMSKYFYITVPFAPVENKEKGIFSQLSGLLRPKQAIIQKRELFETYKSQLWQRVDHIVASLSGIGLKIVPLKTDEIIELLYNSYNPSIYNNAIIRDSEKIELVK